MWAIVTLGYLAIGFIAFKVLYAKWRGDALADLIRAKAELALAKEAMDNAPYLDSAYDAWRSATERHSEAKSFSRACNRKVLNNKHLPVSIFAGSLWPLTLVVFIAIGLGLLIKVTLFRGGLDKGAWRRADRIAARERAALEQKRREAELIALGRKILESPEEES